MDLSCDKCGTTDFAVEGRPFAASFICPDCRLVMCSACAGRDRTHEIPLLCCFRCGTTGLLAAEVWVERLGWRPATSEPPASE